MSIVLTTEELMEVTGYRQAARQIKWLKKNKFTFRLARAGRPVVDRSHYLSRMSCELPKKRNSEPNWAAIAGSARKE